MRHARVLFSTLVALSAPLALAGDTVGGVSPAQNLLNTYPGLRVHRDASLTMFYGMPMNAADTAQQAADTFLAQNSDAFGIPSLDLESTWNSLIEAGRGEAFAYRQRLGGLPVENSVFRIMVNNDIGHAVVLASGKLAAIPENGLGDVTVLPEDALLSVQSNPNYAHLPDWTAPELVVYAGEDLNQPATPAWKFAADNHDLANRERWVFFVDATNSQLLFVRPGLNFDNVIGVVNGNGSPGLKPDEASNPPTLLTIPEIKMQVSGGNSANSDRSGNFNITNSGTSPVTVSTSASNGRWVQAIPSQGALITANNTLTPGVSGTVTLNPSPSAFLTSQVNTLIVTDAIHNYYRDRGGPAGLDIVMPSHVNIASTCNAYFDGSSINFYAIGGGCNNTAYTTVNAHEYGHFVVQTLGLAQGSFGEGFGDVGGMLLYDTSIEGADFFTNGQPVRTPVTDNIQYPCSSEIHTCGEVLGGAWYSIRTNMTATYGSAPALTKAQQIEVSWSLITSGGSGNDAATPTTAIESLTVDDDNGNLNDGTPDYTAICNAWNLHNIHCPTVSPIVFTYPDGIPTTLSSSAATNFRVNVTAGSSSPQSGTGKLYYSSNGGGYVTVNMTENTPNNYTASLPAFPCGTQVLFYVSAQTTSSTTVNDPIGGASAAHYAAPPYTSSTVVFTDNFTTDKGWTLGNVSGDTATTGKWNRMVSQSTWGTQPAGGRSGSSDLCAVTDGNAGSSIGANDVDNGKTTLLSPAFNLTGFIDGKISYYRWYSNDQGSNPGTMTFLVDVSNDGTNWVNVETVGPTGTEASNGWVLHEFYVSSKVALSANVRIRFVAQDTIGAIVEAAIDDVTVTGYNCAATCPQPGCDGYDIANSDCIIDLSDLSVLLSNYGLSGPNLPGDVNHDGTVNLSDLASELAVYGHNCN